LFKDVVEYNGGEDGGKGAALGMGKAFNVPYLPFYFYDKGLRNNREIER